MNIVKHIKQYSDAIKIYNLLITEGEARFIGGCVRDSILNRKCSDIDLATTILPEEVEHILKKHKIDYFSIGKAFGTITAIINNQKIEITTLRKDLSCDGRYAQVQFTKDWLEDAQRRDFTINALSCDLEGNVYDFFDGANDLLDRKVRFIGDPEQRIIEDHLRILRFFRFSSYYAKEVDFEGMLATQKYAHLLTHVSGPRIRAELSKIFIAPNAVKTLKLMQSSGVLQHLIPCENDMMPKLEKLYKITYEFGFKVNELLCLGLLLRLSQSRDKILNNFGFTRLEYNILETIINSKITDWSNDAIRDYWQIYKNHFKEIVFVNLAISDVNVDCKKLLHKLFNTSLQESPISSKDLQKLNVSSGKKMGDLLKMAEKLWYKHEFKITKQAILKELSQYVNEL